MCSSPTPLLSNVFSLTIRHSRPLKSLTPSVNDNDYFTLTILRTRYKRNHLPTYLSFSRNTIAYIGRNTKMCYQNRRKFIKKIQHHFLARPHMNCEKHPSASRSFSCTPSGSHIVNFYFSKLFRHTSTSLSGNNGQKTTDTSREDLCTLLRLSCPFAKHLQENQC